MHMKNNSNGDPRQLKQTLKVIFDNRQAGDILMDVAETRWEDLEKAASDRDKWRARVHTLKNAARATTKARKRQPAVTTTHRLHKQRFTFFTRACKTNEQAKDQEKTEEEAKNEQRSSKNGTLRANERAGNSTRERGKFLPQPPTSKTKANINNNTADVGNSSSSSSLFR